MNSNTPSLADLEARLAKLERQNRRLKRLGLLFLLIAGSGFLLAQASCKRSGVAPGAATPAATYDTLVVHRLELRDKAGKLRGLWTAEGEDPGLILYDAAGNLRASLTAAGGGSGLGLYDATGGARAVLNVTAGDTDLFLFDAAGKVRATLVVEATGSKLWLSDAAGELRAWLAEGTFSLTDAQGFKAVVGVTKLQTVATGESHTTSAAAVTLFGKDGKVIWRAP
jgi:hypothetical protein